MYVKFNGSCLVKQHKFTFENRKIGNIYILYDIDLNLNNFDSTLENGFISAIKITKISGIDKHKYSGYGSGFDARGTFSFPGGNFAQNVVICGADMSRFVHASNRTKISYSLVRV